MFRSTALFLSLLATGSASEPYSGLALTPASQFPLKYTALLGTGAHIAGIAVDVDGGVLISGTTYSALPVTAEAFQTDYKTATCEPPLHGSAYPCPLPFAARLSPAGTELVYLTYLLNSNDSAVSATRHSVSGISVDAQGNAWISGGVTSADLAVTPGAFQPTLKGSKNAFVLKLNTAGSRVLFATYLGGSGGADTATSQAIDAEGNFYVAGSTNSTDFPVTTGAFQADAGSDLSGSNACFVTKFDPTGKVIYSTYFHGGKGSSMTIKSIAADLSRNAYVTGTHGGASLPTTSGAFQTSASAMDAAFVAKLDPKGSSLSYSTYLAANSPVSGGAIAVDSLGSAYVAGTIALNEPHLQTTFPVTPGAFQTIPPDFAFPTVLGFGTLSIGFLTKLNATGSGLSYSTFLYASGTVRIGGLKLDGAGSAVILGDTLAMDFPTTTGAMRECNGNGSGFMVQFAADGSRPLYSTYLGGRELAPVAVRSPGEIYIAGGVAGSLPRVPGSFGWTGSGAFIAEFVPGALASGSVTCVASAASRGGPAIAPGEIVDIYGNGIGPPLTLFASLVSEKMPTSLGGVQVLFNGLPAPLFWAGPNQIRAVVPFETGPADLASGPSTAVVQLVNTLVAVQPASVTVEPVAPAIFTVDGRPTGQALMINEDGTVNSERTPARQNSFGTIYATGLNNTRSPLATGSVAPAANPLSFESSLRIGFADVGPGSEITYAGAAPGFVAGLTQINFRVPTPSLPGISPIPVVLYLLSATSQQGVYFYVQ